MSLPSDLVAALPASLTASRVRAAIRAPGSPNSYGGESWLLELDDGLAVVFRTSIFDSLEWLALATDHEDEPAIGLTSDGFSSRLKIRSASGSAFELRPASSDVAAVTALLERVRGLAVDPSLASEPSEATPEPELPEPPRSVASSTSPAAALELLPGELEPPAPRAQLINLRAVSDQPDPETLLAQALERGDFRSAELAARNTSSSSEPEALADLITLLELAAAGSLVPAYLWTRGVKHPPAGPADDFFTALAAALERDDEPTLAWSAWEEVLDEQVSSAARGRLERSLGRSGPTIAREVAERARAWFTKQLADTPNQLDAMRGLARAHTDLDELSEAHRWVRAAIEIEPMHFDTRMQEAQILTLLEIETGDTRPLLTTLNKIADDFPTRTEPLLDLAGHVEFDDPTLAITCLQRALEREFNTHTATSLVELYAATGRHMDVIMLTERSLNSPQLELDEDEREQLQAQLDQSRTALALPAGAALTVEPHKSSRAFAIIVVVILATLGYLLAI